MTDDSINSSIAVAGSTSKSITAIIGLVSGLAGILVGAFGVAFYIRDEFRIWEQIKAVHVNDTVGPSVILYDHTNLSSAAIVAISEAMELPDFSTLATKSEIPTLPELSSFVEYGDDVALRSYASKNHAIGVAGIVDLNAGQDPNGEVLRLVPNEQTPSINQIWTVRKAPSE